MEEEKNTKKMSTILKNLNSPKRKTAASFRRTHNNMDSSTNNDNIMRDTA